MREDPFKQRLLSNQSEKTDVELLQEKSELLDVIESCTHCQSVGIRSGRCHDHRDTLERIEHIESILEFRRELHEMCEIKLE